MFSYVLVLGCACALAVGKKDNSPTYMEKLQMTKNAVDILQKNILSMASGIPLLDDPRRHYAEIVNNVCRQADNLNGCIKKDYDVEYPKVLNMTSATAFVNPQMVVDKIANMIDNVMSSTAKIRSLIESQCKGVNAMVCDQVIGEEVKSDPGRYKFEAKAFLVLGDTAAMFLKMDPIFSHMAILHAGHKYVVEGQSALKELVMSVLDMKRIFWPKLC